MGLFNGLFNGKRSSDEAKEVQAEWIDLEDMDQLEAITEDSHEKMQVVFKHSTSCGISNMVLRRFKSSFALEENEARLYYLDLHRHRDISNEISRKFGIAHESPQLLIVRNGKVVEHDSHSGINTIELKQYI
ncbi:bacillithiol system redox-active protein YtxJ [Eudoraea chungangensis]|uniref:bacillithiol system redox-active protein YtxJ n=1 Tax=Eudoraea chungangensis TaxID=1481905 RepID=UPI0023EAB7EB|nr:bacillithiol system redox-active protein YtxJ [Eudoraea chungangensis]